MTGDAVAAKERIDFLTIFLNYHARLYDSGKPLQINDAEYNILYKELSDFEHRYPELKRKDSPTARVGYLGGGKVIEHFVEMFSLENIYNDQQLHEWLAQFPPDTELFFDLKHDGMAAQLMYEDGGFRGAGTKGDGRIGTDITDHVQLMPDIPKMLPGIDREYVGVTGEFTVDYSSLQEINEFLNEHGRAPLPYTRQAVAGIMMMNYADPFILERIRFDLHGTDLINTQYARFSDFMEYYTTLGFETGEFGVCTVADITPLIEFYNTYANRKFMADHPADGVVIKLNNIDLWRQLGTTQKYPRYAKAFKFPDHVVTTSITAIRQSIGKIGTITPVASIEPTYVDGVEVSSVNLHNSGLIHKRGYYVGSKVELYRAGGVIPKLRDVINNEKAIPYQDPTHCPACRAALRKEEATLYCPNPYCPDVIRARLCFAVSRECFNIKGVNEKTIEALMKKESVKGFTDLFIIFGAAKRYTDFFGGNLPEYLESVYYAIFDQLMRVSISQKKSTIKNFLLALCVPNLNAHNIEKILSKIETCSDLYKLYDHMPLRGYGLTKHSAVQISMHAAARKGEIDNLIQFILKCEEA